MIVGIFFGTLAVIAGLFVASLIIAALVRGAEGFREAMWQNPPLVFGLTLTLLSTYYLATITILTQLGMGEDAIFQQLYQVIMLGGWAYPVGIGLVIMGLVYFALGIKLNKMMET